MSLVNQYGAPYPSPFNNEFESAGYSRNRAIFVAQPRDSKRTTPSWTRRTMLQRARWLYNNFGFAKGATRDMARYSVGTGIIPQSQSKDLAVRQELEAYFKQWSGICEITRRLTFNEVLQLASVAIDVDGDQGIVLTETESNYPQIQVIESHRIASQPNTEKDRIFDGVKIDENGMPVSYFVKDGIDGNEEREIEARSFHLICELDRPDEIRGKTRFHAAINRLQDVWEVLEAETSGIKINSKIALARKTKATGQSFFGKRQVVGDVSTGQLTSEQLFDGAIVDLLEGEDIWAHESNRPSPTFTGYLDFLIRDISSGLGLPSEFVWNPEKLGGTANRFILEKAARRFAERQQVLIKFATRIWGYVISKGVKRGDISPTDDWWKVRWQTPSKITVDVGREAHQNREDIFAGIRSETEDAAERGLDIDDLRSQIEAEAIDRIMRAQNVAKTTGVSFEIALSQISRRTPNGNQPQTQQAAA